MQSLECCGLFHAISNPSRENEALRFVVLDDVIDDIRDEYIPYNLSINGSNYGCARRRVGNSGIHCNVDTEHLEHR